MLAVCVVAREPDGGKVTPAQLADDGVLAVLEVLANLDGMVAALAVVFGIFFVGSVFGGFFGGGGRGRAGDGSGELVSSRGGGGVSKDAARDGAKLEGICAKRYGKGLGKGQRSGGRKRQRAGKLVSGAARSSRQTSAWAIGGRQQQQTAAVAGGAACGMRQRGDGGGERCNLDLIKVLILSTLRGSEQATGKDEGDGCGCRLSCGNRRTAKSDGAVSEWAGAKGGAERDEARQGGRAGDERRSAGEASCDGLSEEDADSGGMRKDCAGRRTRANLVMFGRDGVRVWRAARLTVEPKSGSGPSDRTRLRASPLLPTHCQRPLLEPSAGTQC